MWLGEWFEFFVVDFSGGFFLVEGIVFMIWWGIESVDDYVYEILLYGEKDSGIWMFLEVYILYFEMLMSVMDVWINVC